MSDSGNAYIGAMADQVDFSSLNLDSCNYSNDNNDSGGYNDSNGGSGGNDNNGGDGNDNNGGGGGNDNNYDSYGYDYGYDYDDHYNSSSKTEKESKYIEAKEKNNEKSYSKNTNDNYFNQKPLNAYVFIIKNRMSRLQSEIKRDKLYINLIFYDENITKENKALYDELQLNVVGGFYGLRDIYTLCNLLPKLDKNNLPFILLTSGSCFQKIMNLSSLFKPIKSIAIYCYNKKEYLWMYKNNRKIEIITDNFYEIKKYLKRQKFNPFEIKMSNQISSNPLISFYEYENCYFVFHKSLSLFFQRDFSEPIFDEDCMNEVISFIKNEEEYDSSTKKNLINILLKLHKSKNFTEDALKEYTSENGFVYLFNKIMRRIENGILQLAFFMGPMYYALVRYVKYNISSSLNKSMTLYRRITINNIDLNFYYMALGNIICFPSFTSTSLKYNSFATTNLALKANNMINNMIQEKIEVDMVLYYKYYPNNVSPGIIVGKMSYFQSEQEVLLFPFTFIKVLSIKKIDLNHYQIFCEIINRKSILEFGLQINKKVVLLNDILTTKFFK